MDENDTPIESDKQSSAEPEAQESQATEAVTTEEPAASAPQPPPWPPVAPSFASRHHRAIRITAAAAIAIVLLGGGAAGALAIDHHDSDNSKKPSLNERRDLARNNSNGGPGGRNLPNGNAPGANRNGRLTGEIKSIDGSKIVVDNANGKSTTIKTSDKTQVTTTNSGSLSDVVVGDQLSVSGARNDSAIAANAIRDLGANATAANGVPGPMPLQRNGNRQSVPLPGGEITTGKVTKIDSATITLQANDGNTLTVNTSSATTYTITKTAKVSDLKAGQSITVTGTTGKNGDVTATRITESQLPTRGNTLPRPGSNARAS